LQRHAALRTAAGPIADHLRMHRADVLDTGRGNAAWLQTHPTFRAGTGMVLLDFGVHRTGILHPRHCRRWWCRRAGKVIAGIAPELFQAVVAAEPVGFAFVNVRWLSSARIDTHAADGIDGGVFWGLQVTARI